MKTIEEQIQVMTHYLNGGKVEVFDSGYESWEELENTDFNWGYRDYRIKEKKQTVTIEKWLCEYEGCNELRGSKRFFIIEKAVPFDIAGKKIKLLGSDVIDISNTEE